MKDMDFLEELEILVNKGCLCNKCATNIKEIFKHYTKKFNNSLQYSKEVYKEFKDSFGVDLKNA